MSKQNRSCPFLKTTCISCSLYRGRHMGLWSNQEHADTPQGKSEDDGKDWINSLNAFFAKVSDR